MEEAPENDPPGQDPRDTAAGRAERRMIHERALRSKLTPAQYQDRARIAGSLEERLRQISDSLDRLAKSLGPDAPGTPPGSGSRPTV